jgi:prophage DNA circulation protein
MCDIGASSVVRLNGYLCRSGAGSMIHLLPQFGEITSIVVFL